MVCFKSIFGKLDCEVFVPFIGDFSLVCVTCCCIRDHRSDLSYSCWRYARLDVVNERRWRGYFEWRGERTKKVAWEQSQGHWDGCWWRGGGAVCFRESETMKMVPGFVGIQRRTASGLTPKTFRPSRTRRISTGAILQYYVTTRQTQYIQRLPTSSREIPSLIWNKFEVWLNKQASPVCFYILADTNIQLKVYESNGDSNIKSTSPHPWLH